MTLSELMVRNDRWGMNTQLDIRFTSSVSYHDIYNIRDFHVNGFYEDTIWIFPPTEDETEPTLGDLYYINHAFKGTTKLYIYVQGNRDRVYAGFFSDFPQLYKYRVHSFEENEIVLEEPSYD